jgi:hypothetical protein
MKIEKQGRVEIEIDQYFFVFIVALTEKGVKTMCTREQCDGKQVFGETPTGIKEKARKKAIAEFKKPIDDQPILPFKNPEA